jgi:uncharacterized delta-60 repeat protein
MDAEGWATSVAVQSDGGILVGGASWDEASRSGTAAVWRLHAGGTLDAAFGSAGMALFGQIGQVGSVAPMSDGGVLTAGTTANASGTAAAGTVWRLLAGGVLDESFGNAGIAQLDVPDSDLASLALAPDGTIVVGGRRFYRTGALDDFLIGRFLASGKVDGSFGTNGSTITNLESPLDYDRFDDAQSVLVTSSRRAVLVGSSSGTSDSTFALVGYRL